LARQDSRRFLLLNALNDFRDVTDGLDDTDDGSTGVADGGGEDADPARVTAITADLDIKACNSVAAGQDSIPRAGRLANA
jgi:hypothetical protein